MTTTDEDTIPDTLEAFPSLYNESHLTELPSPRERGYTIEKLEQGKLLFSEVSTKAYYEPREDSTLAEGLPSDFFRTSVRDIHSWACKHEIEDFDVTLFACNKNDKIRFELRVNPNCFNRIREKHGKAGPYVKDGWKESLHERLMKLSDIIAEKTAGVFLFCEKRLRIIYLPWERKNLPLPSTVDQLSDARLDDAQEDIISFVTSQRRNNGFTASYSMGGWRKNKKQAHIKIRFPGSDVLEEMRREAEAKQRRKTLRRSDSHDWRARS